jgi:hypothetical protein
MITLTPLMSADVNLSTSPIRHPSSGLKLQNEPISYIQGGIDHFIHGLTVDHCPGSYSWWSKDPPNDGTVTGVGKMELIAIVDVENALCALGSMVNKDNNC